MYSKQKKMYNMLRILLLHGEKALCPAVGYCNIRYTLTLQPVGRSVIGYQALIPPTKCHTV